MRKIDSFHLKGYHQITSSKKSLLSRFKGRDCIKNEEVNTSPFFMSEIQVALTYLIISKDI